MAKLYETDMTMVEFNQRIADELSDCTQMPKDRIRAQCIRCLYDPREPGSALEQITVCSMPECNVFHHRPRVGDGVVDKSEVVAPMASIRNFCTTCIYDAGNGNGSRKHQVESCVDRECSLWSVR